MKKTLPFTVWDPHFFRDDDGKVFLYRGSSDRVPIKVVQLKNKTDNRQFGNRLFHKLVRIETN
jgi:hypothetical protein